MKKYAIFFFRFHRIKIAIRHLNRLLRQCNLQRRKNHSNINTVIKFIQDELNVLARVLAIDTCYRSYVAADLQLIKKPLG